MRPLLIASFGTAFAGLAAWSMAGMVAMGNVSAFDPAHFALKPHVQAATVKQARLSAYVSTDKASRLVAAAKTVITVKDAKPAIVASLTGGSGKSARHADAAGTEVAAVAPATGHAARFDTIARQADLRSKKLASLFSASSVELQQLASATADADQPVLPASVAERPTILAYADPSPGGAADTALSTLLTGPSEEELAAAQAEAEAAVLPDYVETPSAGPRPELRPEETAAKPADAGKADAGEPEADEPKTADKPETRKPAKLAYARPEIPEDKPGSTLGQSLRSLFGGKTRAGNGVAVYDISAAKVYMPDGSVLEAHSGIGNMADNPRYVHVKMNGPTPPHTYNLKMRESRFHGVEAIRMLPVDGKNKYGRDGFLTHSYLLRGGREESHGCVAFADYKRFLTAFKQGKVKQMIVVPSGGRESFRLASNGKSI
ncbi:DUF2778 domain-containing protein [Aminobacter anthyllidis]|uniref:tlde1 domain-containing protein n=1 Tax=Aminobacter anthyllidis TaxID=1035067 RepID=UPI002458D004|nr:tlde1 domain-containing protein [Aminobacter anthyllidis]MDH4988731.1 DUF2778 domain-containing protein [Aminobacter anthyllidis]